MDWRTRQGTRAQASGQRSSSDCIWGGMPGKCWLSEKAREPGVSGDPFSRSLAARGRGRKCARCSLWSHASGGSGLGCANRARNVGSCHPQVSDVTEMETHTCPTIN